MPAGVPTYRGGIYVCSHNNGLQDQPVYLVREGLDAEPRVLLDVNALSSDGSVSVANSQLSPDGRHFGYAVSTGGSDWTEIRVREVETGEDLDDVIRWVKFSYISWTRDGRGFFYSRFPEPEGDILTAANRDDSVWYHALGTPQSEDRQIYARPDQPDWLLFTIMSEDGDYLFIGEVTSPNRNALFYADLGDAGDPRIDAPVVPMIEHHDAYFEPLGNVGPLFYVLTSAEAPNRRVIAIDASDPASSRWRTIVREGDHVIENATIAGGRLILEYLEDAKSVLRMYALDGTDIGDVPLPGIGSVGALAGEPDRDELFYTFESFLTPATVYRYDIAADSNEVHFESDMAFDADAYETVQVFYPSKDGTRIPMFLTYRRGLERDGTNPVWLEGYGGFNAAITPFFQATPIPWLEQGGIVAVANLRGGGEYGEAWHRAGMRENKQNVFDDFIAAAEYLVSEDWSGPEHIAIHGASNGGLLVGAAMTQRPDLFAVAVPEVGVMDMLRFPRFTGGGSLGQRVRLPRRAGGFPNPVRLFAVAQASRGYVLPGHVRGHGRPRRPRRAHSLVQVRGGALGGPGVR